MALVNSDVMNTSRNMYKRYRFPAEIIQYAVWVYYRFNVSHRDIEDFCVFHYLSTKTNVRTIFKNTVRLLTYLKCFEIVSIQPL